MADRKEELKILLMKVKEENDKAGLKLNIQETMIMTSGPFTSQQVDEKKKKRKENSDKFYILGLQNHLRWGLQP